MFDSQLKQSDLESAFARNPGRVIGGFGIGLRALPFLFTGVWVVGCGTTIATQNDTEGPGVEECTNGIDDDSNGMADCEEFNCRELCQAQPTGVCCYVGSDACVEIEEAECASTIGAFSGNGTSCAVNGCPDIVGACCTGMDCMLVIEHDCTGPGASFQGLGIDCSPNPCVIATGACCDINGLCQDLTEAQCEVLVSNVYLGDGTFCSGSCF